MIFQPKHLGRLLAGSLIILVMSLAACAPETASTEAPATVAPATEAPAEAPTEAPALDASAVQLVELPKGRGAIKGWWQVYFSIPTGERNRALWVDGVDTVVAEAINNTQNTLDIAAFELNNEVITEAIADAHERGVAVRIVTDDDHGTEDDDSTLAELEALGIPIVDDARSGLMHNKFIVMDGINVFMGSMNLTMNCAYRNDNNFLIMRSRPAAEVYTAEFEEMFTRGEFGITSSTGNERTFTQEGTEVTILFGAEDDVTGEIVRHIQGAQERIRFMAFAYTLEEVGEAMLERASAGVSVEGAFETTGSGTRFSRFTTLYCAGLDVRRDGNAGILHHKVIIVDDTVITGSFNFSGNASRSNDENIIFITDADLAEQYIIEFERVQAMATYPEEWDCE